MSAETIEVAIDTIRQAQTIELVIPEDTPGGKNWAPHQFAPSVQLARVGQAEVETLPRKEVALDSAPLQIQLGERIGWMGFVDVYRVQLGSSSPRPGLVAKIIDLSLFSPNVSPTRAHVERLFAKQYHICTVLEPIQGSVVPYLGGLFGNGTLYCAIYEDAGRRLSWDERSDQEIGDRFLAAMRTMQDAGVAFCPSHQGVCIDDSGNIKIADFENSATITGFTPRVLAIWEEMDEDYAGWTPEQHMARANKGTLKLAMDFIGRYPSSSSASASPSSSVPSSPSPSP